VVRFISPQSEISFIQSLRIREGRFRAGLKAVKKKNVLFLIIESGA
jgi:hypothetical protein